MADNYKFNVVLNQTWRANEGCCYIAWEEEVSFQSIDSKERFCFT